MGPLVIWFSEYWVRVDCLMSAWCVVLLVPFFTCPELVVSHNIYLWYHKSICIQDISHIAKICFDKDMLTPKLIRSVPALLASDVQMFFLKGV